MTGYCGQELWFALKGIDKIYEVLESCFRISSINNSPIVFYDLSDTGYISDLVASRLLVISASGLLNDKKVLLPQIAAVLGYIQCSCYSQNKHKLTYII